MKLVVILVTVFAIWLIQNYFWKQFWARNLTVSLEFLSKAVIEGDTAQIRETITNNKILPLPILHVKFEMGRELVFVESNNSKITDQNYRSDIFSCMPWQKIIRTLDIRCTKRGYYTIKSADLVSYDLFMSSHFATSVPEDTAIYVYPSMADPIRLNLPLEDLLGQILAKQSLIRDPFEMQNIRPYQTYDTFRDINWKATAKTGDLKVNVYAPTSSWSATFFLDTDIDSVWKDNDLTEEAIRLCASMADHLLRQGIPVAVFSNGLDCISGLPAFIDAGAGKDHIAAVMELLSRIIVDQHKDVQHYVNEDDIVRRPMIEHLEEWIKEGRAGGKSVYVLISSNQTERLMNTYAKLCSSSPGSEWIIPMRPRESLKITDHPSCFSIYPWEVPYGHAQNP